MLTQADLQRALREALGYYGLTEIELARLSGVSQPVINKVVKGQSGASLETVGKLLPWLNKTAPRYDVRAAVRAAMTFYGLDEKGLAARAGVSKDLVVDIAAGKKRALRTDTKAKLRPFLECKALRATAQ